MHQTCLHKTIFHLCAVLVENLRDPPFLGGEDLTLSFEFPYLHTTNKLHFKAEFRKNNGKLGLEADPAWCLISSSGPMHYLLNQGWMKWWTWKEIVQSVHFYWLAFVNHSLKQVLTKKLFKLSFLISSLCILKTMNAFPFSHPVITSEFLKREISWLE